VPAEGDTLMYQIIHDVEELKWFHENVLPELQATESHFVSLSARNKYLSGEEKISTALCGTEMFEKRLVSTNSWRSFLRTIRKFETNEGSYTTTKTGANIPAKALVVYLNINPSDALKAYRDFTHKMNEYMFEISQIALKKRDSSNIMAKVRKQQSLLMNSYQKAPGKKTWLDFDFDIDKRFYPSMQIIAKNVKERNGRAYIIDTKSGFHLLVSKDTEFSIDFNPTSIVKLSTELAYKLEIEYDEIILNKNAMIPLPGTYQGGHPVKILNKEQ